MTMTQTASPIIATRIDHDNLRARLRALQMDGTSFAAIGTDTGVSRTAISQFVNNGLQLSGDKLLAIKTYLDEQDGGQGEIARIAEQVQQSGPVRYKRVVELYKTAEYRKAIGWCQYIRDKRKMGVVVGFPGTGKTTILKEYARMTSGVIYIDCWPTMRLSDMSRLLASELGISIKGSQHERIMQIVAELSNRTDVTLVFDEAENLRSWNILKLEILRKVWDNTGTPVILCGTPKLEDMLTVGGGRDNLAQLYRRKYKLELDGIGQDEALGILRDYDIAPEAANRLVKVAADVKHGGLGNFVELLDMALEAAEGGRIDETIVRGAMQYKMMY